MSLLKKYKNILLKNSNYNFITSEEKQNLIKFLESEEMKNRGEHDINDMCYDLTHNNLSQSGQSEMDFSLFIGKDDKVENNNLKRDGRK